MPRRTKKTTKTKAKRKRTPRSLIPAVRDVHVKPHTRHLKRGFKRTFTPSHLTDRNDAGEFVPRGGGKPAKRGVKARMVKIRKHLRPKTGKGFEQLRTFDRNKLTDRVTSGPRGGRWIKRGSAQRKLF